jgi:hypothetical protein
MRQLLTGRTGTSISIPRSPGRDFFFRSRSVSAIVYFLAFDFWDIAGLSELRSGAKRLDSVLFPMLLLARGALRARAAVAYR